MNLIIARSVTRRTCSTKVLGWPSDTPPRNRSSKPIRSALHPVVRSIMLAARKFSAVDAFEAQYRLAELARESEKTWQSVDALLLPSAGTIYTVEQMLAAPIELNSNLGRYTNFMNLLDLCGIAIPAGFRSDRIPFGVTLFAKAWADPLLFDARA